MNNLFIMDKKKGLGLSPHALLIKEFKDIWDRDMSENKVIALQELAYVYFMSDYNSEFSGSGIEKEKDVRNSVIFMKRWNPDKAILDAIAKYEKLQHTSSMSHLKYAREALDNVTAYYKSFKYDPDDKENSKFNPAFVTKAMNEMDKMLETILKWERVVFKEEKEEAKIQGGGKIGFFEDSETAIWLHDNKR